jgi:hypothetical protein
MTVSSTTDRKSYAGDDLTVAFGTSPMVFFDETDLQVFVITTATGASDQQALTTDYTVSGGAGSTGTVTMLAAPASTETLLIKRVMPYTQEADFVNGDDNDAEVTEDAFDKLTMIVQQGAADESYPLRLSDAETPTAALTTLPFDRASTFLAFDSSKNLVASTGSDGAAGPLGLALAASGGSALVGFVQFGNGAVPRTVQAKLRAGLPISLEDFDGGPAKSAAVNDVAWAAALTALPTGGGVIEFESTGIYDFAAGLTWSTKPVHLRGQGSNIQPSMGTHLRFAAGLTGINPQNGASGLGSNSGMRDLRIVGQDAGAGSNDGVRIQAPRFYAQNVVVEKFGRHQWAVISGSTTSTNANGYVLINCFGYNGYGSAWYADGNNCIGVTIGLGAQSCDEWGLYDNGLGIVHYSPIIENNATGGHRIGTSGSRCRTHSAYKETDGLPGIQIDAGAGYNKLDYLALSDSVVDNGTVKSEIAVTAGNAVLNRRVSVGNTTANIVLSDLLALLDLGATLKWKNAAQDAIWTAHVLADKRMQIESAQNAALLISNPIQLSAGPGIYNGAGSPSGTLTAAKGSIYLRTDGSTTNDRAFINTNGGTTWTAIVTVA